MQLDNVKSSCHAVTCGIPQGSVLGPLIFNIYINDVTEASTKFDFIMYADDTTLTSSLENFGKLTDAASLERELNEETSKVYCWLLSNKLNYSKLGLAFLFDSNRFESIHIDVRLNRFSPSKSIQKSCDNRFLSSVRIDYGDSFVCRFFVLFFNLTFLRPCMFVRPIMIGY